ncbi:MAG: hypothetical protein VKJ85_04715 [Prochlorothrix sp.]|nr:hypothetical protein [Prochlorothrix sp.]
MSCHIPPMERLPSAVISDLLEPLQAQAQVLDQDPQALAEGWRQIGRWGTPWLAPKLAQTLGEPGFEDPLLAARWQERLTQASGALAFLAVQHQSAAMLLSRSQTQGLEESLEAVKTGKLGLGVAFAHLRRDPCPLEAEQVDGGYHLTGEAPWVTGWGIFDRVVVAATLPDRRIIYGLVPFASADRGEQGSLTCGPPFALVSLASTQTVAIQFDRWYLPQNLVLFERPAGFLAKQDRRKVLGGSLFALGNTAASVALVRSMADRRGGDGLAAAAGSLEQELVALRVAIYGAFAELNQMTEPASETWVQRALQLRGQAIGLMGRSAQAAVAASSGAANTATHSAQRLYRESLAFTVTGQSQAVMAATLRNLTGSSCR